MKVKNYSIILSIFFSTQAIYAGETPTSTPPQLSWMQRIAAKLYIIGDYTKKSTPQSFSSNLLTYNTATRNVLLPKPNENIIADSYQLSPQKKYILTQEVNTGFSFNRMIQTGYQARSKEGIQVEKTLESANVETAITNITTGKKITSFDNIISYEFNKDETLLLVSMPKPVSLQDLLTVNTRWARKKSELHKSKTAVGSPAIFHYQLFDMESQTILSSFENVETISFEGDTSNLCVLYEGNSNIPNYNEYQHYAERINIGEEINQSFFKKAMNLITKNSSKVLTHAELEAGYTQPNKAIIKYNFYKKELSVTTADKKTIKSENVNTYHYSPNKQYLIVQKLSLNIIQNIAENITNVLTLQGSTLTLENLQKPYKIFELINLKSGEIIQISEDQIGIVTYEFSPDERTLLYLKPTKDNITQYYLYDTQFKEITHTFEQGITASFAPHSNTEFNTSSLPEKITIERKRTAIETIKTVEETIEKKYEEIKKEAKQEVEKAFDKLKNLFSSEPEQAIEQKPITEIVSKTITTPIQPTEVKQQEQIPAIEGTQKIIPIKKETTAEEFKTDLEKNWEKAKKQWNDWKPFGK